MKKKNDSGSKFKDATSLLVAYNALQSEFTKKCQELSKFKRTAERKVEENKNNPSAAVIFESKLADRFESVDLTEDEKSKKINSLVGESLPEQKSEGLSENQNLYGKVMEQEISELKVFDDHEKNAEEGFFVEKMPQKSENSENLVQEAVKASIFASPVWREKVADFFASFPDARASARQIAEVLIKDKAIAALDNSLEVAYSLVMAKAGNPASLLNDESFVEQNVLSNQRIRNKFIESYLNELNGNIKKTPPTVVSKGGSLPITPIRKIGSLEEAREHLLNLFR